MSIIATKWSTATVNLEGEISRLGNTSIAFPDVRRMDGKRNRYRVRKGGQVLSNSESFAKCGRVPIGSTVQVLASDGGTRAGFGNLHTCGSVWLCPVCSAKIQVQRRDDVAETLNKAIAEGKIVSMLTLTMQHHKGQTLLDLWNALSDAWNAVTRGRRWAGDKDDPQGVRQGFKANLGLLGYIRAVEVTHGAFGWHVHTHVIMISDKNPMDTMIEWKPKNRGSVEYPVEVVSPIDYVADRWEKELAKHGVGFIANRGGLDWQIADDPAKVGDYVAKLGLSSDDFSDGPGDSLANEATLGAMKRARGGNRTPMQILDDLTRDKRVMRDGEVTPDLMLWWEWERASRDKRALLWSGGLRDWANLDREKTDEEIAQEKAGDEVVAILDQEAWWQVFEIGSVELLLAIETSGPEAGRRWLSDRGIPYLMKGA